MDYWQTQGFATPNPEKDLFIPMYVLTEDFYTHFLKTYTLNDIGDYTKIREVTSLTEIARLAVLGDAVSIRNNPHSPISFRGIFDETRWGGQGNEFNNTGVITFASQDQADDFAVSIFPRFNDSAFIEHVRKSFKKLPKASPSDPCCEATEGAEADSYEDFQKDLMKEQEQFPYRLVPYMGKIYIIVGKDFLSYVEDGKKFHTFLSQLLKLMYSIAPIGVVNKSAIYWQYVATLGAKL